jgi:hypothetical protein
MSTWYKKEQRSVHPRSKLDIHLDFSATMIYSGRRFLNVQGMSRAAQLKLLALVIQACQHSGRLDKVCDEESGGRQNSRRDNKNKRWADIPLMGNEPQ